MLFIHFVDCFHRILHLDGHYELFGYLFLLSFLINIIRLKFVTLKEFCHMNIFRATYAVVVLDVQTVIQQF